MLLLKNLNDAQLASLSNLGNSRWLPFHEFMVVCPILVYLFNKVYIFFK